MKRALVVVLCAGLAACASPRPKFYPNERYPSVGEAVADRDIDECLAEAKRFLKENPLQPMAKEAGWGAVTGAAVGAVVGAITGDFKGALESGAAAGGAGGVVQGAARSSEPDAVIRAYTDRCLALRGYQVIGWR